MCVLISCAIGKQWIVANGTVSDLIQYSMHGNIGATTGLLCYNMLEATKVNSLSLLSTVTTQQVNMFPDKGLQMFTAV